MDECELRDLQDPATWSNEGEIRPPVHSPRAVVSVALARDDFERVADHARRREMKISTFIRETVLEQIASSEDGATVLSVTGGVQTRLTEPKRQPSSAIVATD